MKFVVVFLAVTSLVDATIVAKSTKNECVNHGGKAELQNQAGQPCQQKLVVALTVTANEGKAQSIEADIAVVTDATSKQAKNLQLRNPIRISINKSPVLINYRMFQVGHVPSYAHMVVRRRKKCKDYWYAHDDEAACGFALDRHGEKIFDSQGYCCGKFGQCLEFDDYSYYIFGLYPAQMQFTITVDIQQLSYSTTTGEDVWNKISKLEIGPHKRIALSTNYQMKVEFIADFNPSEFASTGKLAERYILVPDRASEGFRHRRKVFPEQSNYDQSRFISSFNNVSEWLAVRKDMFDLTGTSCYKIGVFYSAFRNMRSCISEAIQEHLSQAMETGDSKTYENAGVCTRNQPYKLWESDTLAKSEGRRGQYMLHHFGHVHSAPSSGPQSIDYQLNFVARRPAKSLIMISMVADDLRTIVRNSPGRIVEAFIEPFEALSNTGLLTAIVQNTGTLSSIYNVFVVHCTAGIDMIPSESVALDPNVLGNISFSMHSFHAIGKINHCELELYDVNSALLDNLTVYFETLDTCFCYGYCGCACGNGTTTCPEAPEHDASKMFESYKPPQWMLDFVDLVGGNFGKIVAGTWVFMALIVLGVLKVVHMLITGEISYDSITNPMGTINNFKKKFCDSCSPHIRDCCLRYCDCERCCLYLCAKCFKGMGQGQFETHANKERRGWSRPRTCDGMCSGAKRARRVHRKQMRINKRKGGCKPDTAWYQKPYVCTCKVKDTMAICDICKGLCFFFYCPLLPVIWTLEFLWSFVRRKWKRHQRKKRFRAMRASLDAKKQQEYLHLDKYSRGKVEKEILQVNEGVATLRKQKKEKDNANFVQDVVEFELKGGEGVSSDSSRSSDTTDADEAGDMEELLSPGFPVYFNFAMAQNIPSSLRSPGTSFSIKGRIRQVEGSYMFDLHQYTYQVKAVVKQKEKALTPPVLLDSSEFTQVLDESRALKLVTLIPLFTKLNDTKK